ncbi:DUF2059 domain-containing protein [Massilia sp. W12]|uniref:DUF2059 domain-containing protein n=1 Tax=Massilia sp. W12 TaxID=3126507 RepID=UPI0030D2F0F1
MKKMIACAVASLALLASQSSLAQASASAHAGHSHGHSHGAADAKPAPPPSPEAEKAARELLAVMKYRDSTAASVRMLLQNLPMALMQSTHQELGKGKLGDEQKKAAMAKAEKDAPEAATKMGNALLGDNKMWDGLEKETATVFARHFKADELRQLAAFYKTPIGVKALQAFPQAMGEASMLGQKTIMPRLQQQIEKFAVEHAK